MSKPTRRLALKSETLRTLSGALLDRVVGGQGDGGPRLGSTARPELTQDRSGHHTCNSHLCTMQPGGPRKTVK